MAQLGLETIRAHRWAIIMALLCVSSASWLIWFWQRGLLFSSATAAHQPSQEERSTLQELQEKNNALEAQVQQLQAGQPQGTPDSSTAATTGELVNINTASQAALESLPGIGASKAAAIIEYRQSNGAFHAPHDITKVKGIGESTYDQLKNQITVGNS